MRTNVQEYLSLKYPNKNQEKISLLEFLDFEEFSELTIDIYPNLKKIYGEFVSNLTKILISNCPRLENIDISQFKNSQELTLSNLPNLKTLVCFNNKLTLVTLDLTLTNYPNLKKINL